MNVPHLFHVLYGEKATKKAVYGSLLFGLIFTLFIAVIFWQPLSNLSLWQTIIILVLAFDIFAGIPANFSEGTNLYYQQRPRLSFVFIILHVQPMVLMLLSGESWLLGLYVYALMLATSTLTRSIKGLTKQTFFGFFFTLITIALLLTYFQPLPTYIDLILIGYNIKLIYGFSVNHHKVHV